METIPKNIQLRIFIDKKYQQKGHATRAIKTMMKSIQKYDLPVWAFVNPNNGPSLELFNKLGYKIADCIRYSEIRNNMCLR